jgi:hypothetical protein
VSDNRREAAGCAVTVGSGVWFALACPWSVCSAVARKISFSVVYRARSPQHRLTVCPITGEKLLDARATWDLIQKHELFERGQLDIRWYGSLWGRTSLGPLRLAREYGLHWRVRGRCVVCPITGEKLLDARATWDLIQKHELFERGQLDIGDVRKRHHNI